MQAAKFPDLHMHTCFSDGTDTPEELLNAIKSTNISVFSVTDHDCIAAAGIMPKLLSAGDPIFISGVEFSCKDEFGKYHILGYGYDHKSADIKALVGKGHEMRVGKVKKRLEFLEREFGFTFPEEEIADILSNKNPGKPHIAAKMVKLGYAANMDDAIYNYLNRLRFHEEYVRPEEAISGVTSSGGIPVLAHPFYGSGDELILGDAMEERLKRLIDFGLKGIEAYYSGFSDKLRAEALALADKYDLYVTAGSDYHGNNKTVKLGDTGFDGYNERLTRFLNAATKRI